MAKSLVSNPPYNLKWDVPLFAGIEPRFAEYSVPPESNANFAFILTALDMIDGKAAFLLPCGILTTDNAKEAAIRKQLIEKNVIEAVITLPDKMFESTSIPTCVLVLNKSKKTLSVEMIDLRQRYAAEQRDQNGQFGGAAHEGRTYHKTVKILTDEVIDKTVRAVETRASESEFCKSVGIEEIRAEGYLLTPARYIAFEERETQHRAYADIAADYNRVVAQKNALKLTVNESLAKSLGLYDVFLMMRNQPDIAASFAVVGQKAEKESFLTLSKNAAEFKIENRSREHFPEILAIFLQMWKQHIMYLNNEENRLLAEFRDALLPDLMSGKIELPGAHGSP